MILTKTDMRVRIGDTYVDLDDLDSMALGDIQDVIEEARLAAAPLANVPTYREFAKNIRLPDGPMQGQIYNPVLDPVHDAVVMMLDAGWSRYVWVGCVQSGKSLLLTLALGRNVTFACAPAVYSQPTKPKIHEAWTGKIMPVLEASDLREWLPSSGQGSKGSQTPEFYQFRRPGVDLRAGLLYFIAGGGKNESAQAAVTAPFIFIDEVDSFPSRHRIELIGKRADSYGPKATRIYTSTVKHDQDSVVLGLYRESTNSRLWFACPSCKTYQTLEWENVRYDTTDEITAGETARYFCPHCGVGWDESARLHALRTYRLVHEGQSVGEDGVVIGDVPRTRTFGLLWTALDSSIRELPTVALEHYRAQQALDNGDHGPMRSFYRDQLCREYTGELDELDAQGPLTWQYLFNRTLQSSYGPSTIITDRDHDRVDSLGFAQFLFSRRICEPPAEATHCVGAIDVQANRVYWILRAFDMVGTSYIYAWGYEYFTRDRMHGNETEIGITLRNTVNVMKGYARDTDFRLIGIDVGDGVVTDMLRRWISENNPDGQIIAMKGGNFSYQSKEHDLDGLAWYRDGQLLFNADNARDMVHASFRRPLKNNGSTHFPSGIDKTDISIFRHMVSEQSAIDPATKKKIILKGTGRNDWLDCAKMTQVLMHGVVVEQYTHQRKEAYKIHHEDEAKKLKRVTFDDDATAVDHSEPEERESFHVRSQLQVQRSRDRDMYRGRPLGRIQRRYKTGPKG